MDPQAADVLNRIAEHLESIRWTLVALELIMGFALITRNRRED